MPTKLVFDIATGEADEIEMEGDELAAYEAQRAVEDADPGPTRAERVDALVAEGVAALAGATTIAEIKVVFAAALTGLGAIDGTGGAP